MDNGVPTFIKGILYHDEIPLYVYKDKPLEEQSTEYTQQSGIDSISTASSISEQLFGKNTTISSSGISQENYSTNVEYIQVNPTARTVLFNNINKIDAGNYELISLAGNTNFYNILNIGSCSQLDCKYFKDSLNTIIDYHNTNQSTIDQKNYTATEFIAQGGFNKTFHLDDGNVFRMLSLDKNTDPKMMIPLNTSQPTNQSIFKYQISQNSLRELYGLIIQYYFTKTCTNHVCKVFDFGIMNYNGDNIAYAILEKADMDMNQFLTRPYNITSSQFKQLYKDVYDAIKCIHTNGFVHSDIKPENIGIVIEGQEDHEYGIVTINEDELTELINELKLIRKQICSTL